MPNDPVDYQHPPIHLYESTDWEHHEECPYWREDGSNDPSGAVLIRQGEGIRYECIVNNGVLPLQWATAPGFPPPTGDPTTDRLLQDLVSGAARTASDFPPYTLASQQVLLEPRDGFGKVPRVKYSCEEISGVVPGFPGAGAVGYYQNRSCLPDVLKGKDPALDPFADDTRQAMLEGGPATECKATDSWHQFCGGYCSPPVFPFSGHYTGKCVPASIGFAETEDDEMCILLGLYAFSDDDVVPIGSGGPLGPNGIDRLPTDVGR
jgi:hypothetical protein